MMITVENLGIRYGELDIVKGVSFEVVENEWLMIVGPNGAGKSTIVKAIAQGVPYTGTITFGGQNLAGVGPAWLSKRLGVLAQQNQVAYAFTVREVVKLGRYTWSRGIFSTPTDQDDEMIDRALATTGLADIQNQSVLTLSGGELQRTFLAQILAQDPKLLILDEPTNHLDLIYQKQVFDLIAQWVKEPGHAVISVVHDLSLARCYGTGALLVGDGEVQARGGIEAALSPENLNRVYKMDVGGWMHKMLNQWVS